MLTLEVKNKKVNFIGDPHLGKKFGGVPLHRTGERELMQMTQFKQELNAEADVTIMVGDLFDTFLVTNEVLVDTYNALVEATTNNPKRIFVLISGNHDISRDSDVLSSFHVLVEMLQGYPRIKTFMDVEPFAIDGLTMLLAPYSMFKTAEEAIAKYTAMTFDLIVGHWDTLLISGPHNLMPFKLLANMTKVVVSGHEHAPYLFYIDKEGNHANEMGEPDAIVYGTGSMQPYSHGEDPHGKMYLTLTLEQVLPALEKNPDAYKDKAVRLVLGPNEQPVDFNCLQFSIKRVTVEQKEELEVTLGDFDFKELFMETFKENNVPDDITGIYWEKYKQKANDDN